MRSKLCGKTSESSIRNEIMGCRVLVKNVNFYVSFMQ